MAQHEGLLQIHLLGGFSLTYDGEVLPPVASRHARLLFAWLALQGGRPQPRSVLADRFFPDVPENRARRRLSHALWQVQDCFSEAAPDRGYLLTPGDAVTFDTDAAYWLDVEEFEQRIDAVDAGGATDNAGLRNLRRCVELYQGDLLAGSYEAWVLDEQERLRQRHIGVLTRLAQACKQRGNFEEALAVARRLTHQAPLQEEGHREVMRLCVLLGQPSQALEQFDRCRSVLEEELGTGPSAATVELARQVGASRATGAPARAAPVEQLESDRLVGREDERVRIVDQLERTMAGEAGALLVEGEAGIGKTQLLAQAVEDARWRGFTVLWGGAGHGHVPYEAVRQALLPELTPVRIAQLHAHVEPVWLATAGQLLPPLREAAAPSSDARPLALGSDGADRMREALARVVAGLAALDPVLLVLEDLHRADPETLALLRSVAMHRESGRLLVLGSYRGIEARSEGPVWEALRAIDRDVRPTRLVLDALSVFETGVLLREVLGAQHVPASFVEAMHRESDGNPLYALELLRALRDAGSLRDGPTEQLESLVVPVTDGLRELIGGRLALLDHDAAEVAGLAAVLGASCAIDTLRAAADLEPRALAVSFGELARRNLVELDVAHASFTHAATRRVLLDGLADDTRVRLQLAAADALERTHPDEAETLSALLYEADRPGRALPHLRRAAANAVRLHAYETAARHLEAAVACSARVPLATEERRLLLFEAEEVFGIVGRRDDQGRVLEDLATLVGGDPDLLVEVQCRRVVRLGHLDRFPEAVAVAEATADLVEDRAALRARLLTALGRVLGWSGDNERSVEVLATAVALHDDPTAAGPARFSLGTALRFLQRFDEAEHELRAALDAAVATDDEVLAIQCRSALATVLAETGASQEAASLFEEAIAAARRIGFRHREGVCLVNLATLRATRADVAGAVTAYDAAESIFASLGNRRGVATVALNRAWLRHRWLGDDDGATDDVDHAADYFASVHSHGQLATCRETSAAIARRAGDEKAARDSLDLGLEAARAASDRRSEVQLLRGHVELSLRLGDGAAALDTAQRGVESALAAGVPEFVSELASLGALAAVRVGASQQALELTATATAHLAVSAEQHRVHHRLALVAEGLGRSGEASLHHRTAARLLEEGLAGVADAAVERALSAVGTHAAIVAAAAAHEPRRLALEVARSDAPRGRAPRHDETVTVTVELPPASDVPTERRAHLLTLLRRLDEHGGQPTVADLTAALDVSTSTIRRDLRALREQGFDAATRGSGTG